MELNRLRTLVFEKTGIKIGTDDPIFALVALNEAVLAECVEPHVAALNQAAHQLSQQTNKLVHASEIYTLLLQQLGNISDQGKTVQIEPVLVKEGEISRQPFSLKLPYLIVGAMCI